MIFFSDNLFINNNLTEGGTNILSVIPYINTNYNNPYKLNLWFDINNVLNTNNSSNSISYNLTNVYDVGWEDTDRPFLFTFVSISGLPPLFFPQMRSLFTNNAQVYYKPHSLSTGSGGSGVRNYRKKKLRT